MPDAARPTVPVSAPPAETETGAASEPTSWQPGDVVLGLYEVREVFTGGGMGLVYRARHHGWGTDLAVKRPRRGLLVSEADRAEFEREAEMWIGLGLHPHIAACHYVRRIDGAPCVFAEYVGAGTLADWVHDGRLYAGGPEAALSRVLDVAIQAARGLAHAHRHGLVHQDVKPGNVLMTADGVAKVTDFGLAGRHAAVRAPEGGGSLVVSWVGTGTPAYCPPEQARGEPLSAQSDVYSWGVTVLELFTGEVTWPAGPVAGAALEARLTDPSCAGLPEIPPAVADLLRACLRDDPDLRPRDMGEIDATLCRAWEETHGRAYQRPASRPDPRPADVLNNRAVSLLDLGSRAEAVRLWREVLRSHRDHPEATYNLGLHRWRTRGGGAPDDPDALPPGTDWDHLVRDLEEVQASYPGEWLPPYLLAQAEMEYGDPEAALERLGAITGSDADRVEVRELRESARAATAGAERLPYQAPMALCPPQPVGAVFETEDAVRSALAEADRLRGAGEYGRAAASIEAARAMPGARRRADLVRAWGQLYPKLARTGFRGGWELELLEGHSHPVTAVAISPDGEWVLSGCAGGELRLWETAGGRCVWANRDHGQPVRAVKFGTDGRTAITAGGDDKGGREFFWDLTTRKRTRTVHLQNVPYQPDDEATYFAEFNERRSELRAAEVLRSLELSACGRFLLWLDAAYRVRLVDTAGGIATRQSVHEHVPGRALSVALSPDARFALLSPAWDGSLHLWDLAGGRCVHVVGAGSGLPSRVLAITPKPIAWSPDGALVLTVGNDYSLRVVELADGRCRQVLAGHFDRVTSLAWSGDGRYALSAGEDETVRLWDAETGACLRVFRGHRSGVSAVAFSPDGRFAVSAGRDRTVRLFALDWGLEDRPRADWDDSARPYLSAFLARHAPPVTDEAEWARLTGREPSRCDSKHLVPCGLVRGGHPRWTKPEFAELVASLARAGFSWLRAVGVGRELHRLADEWDGGLTRFVRSPPGPDAEMKLWWRGLEIRDGYLYRRDFSSALTPAVEGVPLAQLRGVSLGRASRRWVGAGLFVILFGLVCVAVSFAVLGVGGGYQLIVMGFLMMFLRGTRYLELWTTFGLIRFAFGKRAHHLAFVEALQRVLREKPPTPERPCARVVAVCPACKKHGGPAVDPATGEPTGTVLRVRAPCRDCRYKYKRRVAGRRPYRFGEDGILDLVPDDCDSE